MARSLCFARLRALASPPTPRLHARDGAKVSRRDLLKACMVGATGNLMLSRRARATTGVRVAVIGAGLAGLTCAYRLREAGVDVTVYEASARTGGRMHTLRGAFPSGQVCELGAELIDHDHVHLHNLADELGVGLDDRAEASARLRGEVFTIGGGVVPAHLIAAQLSAALPTMRRLAAQADAASPSFDPRVLAALDRTPLSAWLARHLRDQRALRSVLESAYRGEFGLDPEAQSALNLLFLITSGGEGELALFGGSDERYHAHDGSQSFTDALTGKLHDCIVRESSLVSVRGDARCGYTLALRERATTRSVRADVVVLALPFSTLREVELGRLPLSPQKRVAIAELRYGTNAKLMGAFRTRVWRKQHGALGSITSDEPYQQAWDTSIGQAGASGILTDFLGGSYGLHCDRVSPEQWYATHFVPAVERAFPGARAAYVAGSAVRMHWPSYPHAKGSYLCYGPGQWRLHGSEGVTEQAGTLYFCGEHASVDHQGFMEGAAETGELTAGAILTRLGLRTSARHEWALRYAHAVPQPVLGQPVRRGAYVMRRRTRERALCALLREGARRLDVSFAPAASRRLTRL